MMTKKETPRKTRQKKSSATKKKKTKDNGEVNRTQRNETRLLKVRLAGANERSQRDNAKCENANDGGKLAVGPGLGERNNAATC